MVPELIRADSTPAWASLVRHCESGARALDARQLLQDDPGRAERMTLQAPLVTADLSKNRIDDTALSLLLALAQQCGVAQRRDAMFDGEPINTTENRAVLHTLLRTPANARVAPALSARLAWVHGTLEAMLAYAERIRSDEAITDVVNIGIGGSDLGPQMAVLALDSFVVPGKRFHFVSNVDGHELDAVLSQLRPNRTLFVIASKTFTTLETMTNARSAKAWFHAQGGTDVARHFAALTTNVEAAKAFGIDTTFGFWDWVGGRYSLWSAIGLTIAIAIGGRHFRAMLAGGHAMDLHFRHAAPQQNLPMLLGLLDVWSRDFLGLSTRGIAPYHSGLRRLPAYLQQLEMESNGKRVDLHGQPLPYATCPVIWGEPGTNGQHAFFQMLHQGTEVVPVEFIVVKEAAHTLPGHHEQLLANALAQAQALLQGQQDPGGHRDFPGNRPSTMLVLERLDPASLGALIALYEHRVFTAGAIWGINSFDQWGVELGKVLAQDIIPRLSSGDTSGLDASTANLVRLLRR